MSNRTEYYAPIARTARIKPRVARQPRPHRQPRPCRPTKPITKRRTARNKAVRRTEYNLSVRALQR